MLDLTSQEMTNGEPFVDLSRFTMQRYRSIVRYKTAFYSFYLPVAGAMIMAGLGNGRQVDSEHPIMHQGGKSHKSGNNQLFEQVG